MTLSSHSKIRLLRISLYSIIFVVFVSLFNTYGTMDVRGQEYFSAPSDQMMIFILVVSIIGLAVVTYFIRRIHKNQLERLDEKTELLASVKQKKKSLKKKAVKKTSKKTSKRSSRK